MASRSPKKCGLLKRFNANGLPNFFFFEKVAKPEKA